MNEENKNKNKNKNSKKKEFKSKDVVNSWLGAISSTIFWIVLAVFLLGWQWWIFLLIFFGIYNPIRVTVLYLSTGTKKCPNCGSRLPADTKFCSICGVKFLDVCPSCGSVVVKPGKYCDKCGNSLMVGDTGVSVGQNVGGAKKEAGNDNTAGEIKNNPSIDRDKKINTNVRYCPACGNQVDSAFEACPVCGFEL